MTTKTRTENRAFLYTTSISKPHGFVPLPVPGSREHHLGSLTKAYSKKHLVSCCVSAEAWGAMWSWNFSMIRSNAATT